jgi:hypothetical protein
MNYGNLQEALDSELFTDLTLVLSDGLRDVSINVHKLVLYSCCDYFKKILATEMKEKNLNEITITVPNAFVAHDIIMSLYGKKTNLGELSDTEHYLESILCWDFFCIGYDKKLLSDIKISADNFELLVRVINSVGYDDDTIKLIKNSLPENYDLKKIPKKILMELLDLAKMYCIVSVDNSFAMNNDDDMEYKIIRFE